MTDITTIFFDVDDTLFDRKKAQREILHLIMREFDDVFAGIDEETITNAFLESDRVATQELHAGGPPDVARIGRSKVFLRMLGLDEDFADKITAMYVKWYPRIYAPVKGARLVLENLAKKFQLGVISNGLPDIHYQKLQTLGIEHLFDCILLSQEVGFRKPDPRIFWKATTILAKEPKECLYVGDSYDDDVLGAKKAGLQACWFNPHGLRVSQADVKSDFEIRALDEIFEILDCE